MPKTKIICTMGPATGNVTTLRKMFMAGMDVVRLNFSHGTHETHAKFVKLVREINKRYRRRVRILVDLEGHRIRIGRLKGGGPLPLHRRQLLWLTNRELKGDENIVSIDYRRPLTDIAGGVLIYIDDGNIALQVKKVQKDKLLTEVVRGGELKEHKGVNIPGAALRFDGLSEKDRRDIEFAVEHQVDFIAQSFVIDKHDMLDVKKAVGDRIPGCRYIAKIENQDGINNLGRILEVSDGIMVARGDMGVSLPIYEVPFHQKEIIRRCNSRGKFVITATQMLESMVKNRIPTRAEVSDVANAILDGTDYVMLSAETAVGDFPAETVDMMNDIIVHSEKYVNKVCPMFSSPRK